MVVCEFTWKCMKLFMVYECNESVWMYMSQYDGIWKWWSYMNVNDSKWMYMKIYKSGMNAYESL